MKLAIFNGSPRGRGSNTKLLLQHFCNGFEANGGKVILTEYLIKQNSINEQVEHFKNADNIFIAFPLYTDSMPGIVKRFIEEIGNFDGNGKQILFLVQSGFSEGIHSEGVKKYLELLTKRWKMKSMGIIVKPGVEGIRIMPKWMTKKLFLKMNNFGSQIAILQEIDKNDITKLAKPYKFSKFRLGVSRLMQITGLANFYWNSNLKKYNAFDRRFDAPYLE